MKRAKEELGIFLAFLAVVGTIAGVIVLAFVLGGEKAVEGLFIVLIISGAFAGFRDIVKNSQRLRKLK